MQRWKYLKKRGVNVMSNLNGMRKLISTAMCKGDKTITMPVENASMFVVEYERSQVAASDAIGEIDDLKEDKQILISALDKIMDVLDTDALNELTEEEAAVCRRIVEAYRAAKGAI